MPKASSTGQGAGWVKPGGHPRGGNRRPLVTLVTLNKTTWPRIGSGKLRYTAAARVGLTDSLSGQECALGNQSCVFVPAPPSPPGRSPARPCTLLGFSLLLHLVGLTKGTCQIL